MNTLIQNFNRFLNEDNLKNFKKFLKNLQFILFFLMQKFGLKFSLSHRQVLIYNNLFVVFIFDEPLKSYFNAKL